MECRALKIPRALDTPVILSLLFIKFAAHPVTFLEAGWAIETNRANVTFVRHYSIPHT